MLIVPDEKKTEMENRSKAISTEKEINGKQSQPNA